MQQDTIFGLSSGHAPAGVAVIRISGPLTATVLAQMVGKLPPERHAALKTIRNRNEEPIDQSLVLFFPRPRSFTGEDVAELHVHGSRAVIAAVEAALELAGLRRAEAGEFTRRAFEHGRLDLVEVEALSDLVSAETEMQRRLALEVGSGTLSRKYEGWAQRLTYARAMIEADLDFADEDDVPGSVAEEMLGDLHLLRMEMKAEADSVQAAEIIRSGFHVAIVGAPNSGKSSLLNALARREVAIVTDVAGTTRDVIAIDIDLGGYLVRFFDTAGIRETDDIVEIEGIRRAKLTAQGADLVLQLTEAGMDPLELGFIPSSSIAVGTKADIHGLIGPFDVHVSTVTETGLDKLRDLVLAQVQLKTNVAAAAGNRRHLDYIRSASKHIEIGLQQAQSELRAEALRAAATELGRITGRVDVEDLLDVIFSKFCIGK